MGGKKHRDVIRSSFASGKIIGCYTGILAPVSKTEVQEPGFPEVPGNELRAGAEEGNI